MKSSPDIPESTNQGTKDSKGATVKNSIPMLKLKLKLDSKDHPELSHISDGSY